MNKALVIFSWKCSQPLSHGLALWLFHVNEAFIPHQKTALLLARWSQVIHWMMGCARFRDIFWLFYDNYRPQRSWDKVMFLQASVILLTGGGGVPHPPPREQTPPPGADPPEQTPPRADTHPPWSRHPPEQTPPPGEHAVRYGQRTGGTHPTGMQSCLMANQLICWSVTSRATWRESGNVMFFTDYWPAEEDFRNLHHVLFHCLFADQAIQFCCWKKCPFRLDW